MAAAQLQDLHRCYLLKFVEFGTMVPSIHLYNLYVSWCFNLIFVHVHACRWKSKDPHTHTHIYMKIHAAYLQHEKNLQIYPNLQSAVKMLRWNLAQAVIHSVVSCVHANMFSISGAPHTIPNHPSEPVKFRLSTWHGSFVNTV